MMSDISVPGLLAAAGAPLSMTLGFILWDKLWKGSAIMLNMYKCSLASSVFLLAVAGYSLSSASPLLNHPLLFEQDGLAFNMLLLSSVIGIVVGDVLWLVGLLLLGTRRVVIVDMLKPFLAAGAGALFLDQELSAMAAVGIVVTSVGILVVSLEREPPPLDEEDETVVGGSEHGSDDGDVLMLTVGEEVAKKSKQPASPAAAVVDASAPNNAAAAKLRPRRCSPSLLRGYAAAFVNVLLDVAGSVLTRAYGVGLTTWDINLVRFGCAALILAIGLLCVRFFVWAQWRWLGPPTKTELKLPGWACLPEAMDRRAWTYVALGVMLVTFLCPAMSQYALFELELGIALTLNSIGPLYALPLTWLMKRERITPRACVGSLLAVAGIPLLALGAEA